ncbi:MAG TPA: hypothetical protein VFU21_20025 [Kofleriaceae bacterium]|nr:hypothetical protein [Kofleriaceae bacterium]
MHRLPSGHTLLLSFSLIAGAAACGDDSVDSDEEARRAYLGLDNSVEKALNLGMDGYSAADNANIPDQSGVGEVAGTIVVSGQVDAGVSDNKEMRLYIALVDYTDGPFAVDEDSEEEIDITYDTLADALPYLELSLRDIPDGTFTGTLTGDYSMTGDLEGEVTLDLTMDGEIEGPDADTITRVEGTTHVTGTASAGDGTYEVDVTI